MDFKIIDNKQYEWNKEGIVGLLTDLQEEQWNKLRYMGSEPTQQRDNVNNAVDILDYVIRTIKEGKVLI